MGDELDAESAISVNTIKSKYSNTHILKSPKSGYLQYIDSESLFELVYSFDAVAYTLGRRHLVEGVELGKLYANNNLEKSQLKSLLDQFVIGKTKNAQQDLEFSIHQMVEIAVRALSPGVNDPYTAIACIDNLTSTMCYLSQIDFPSKYRIDKEKTCG